MKVLSHMCVGMVQKVRRGTWWPWGWSREHEAVHCL